MLAFKFPANYLSALDLSAVSIFDGVESNDASVQLEAIESNLRTAQQRARERRYIEAIDAYKAAQSQVYALIQPSHSLVGHLLDDRVMLPVGRLLETAIADASLKLAEAVQPVTIHPTAPVNSNGAPAPAELVKLAALGFSQDDSVLISVRERADLGLEHLANDRLPQAIEALKEALRAVGQPQTRDENATAGAVALDLSSALLMIGRAENARAVAGRAAAFFEAAEDQAGQSMALHNTAVALSQQGQPDAAGAAFERSSAAFAALADRWAGGAAAKVGLPIHGNGGQNVDVQPADIVVSPDVVQPPGHGGSLGHGGPPFQKVATQTLAALNVPPSVSLAGRSLLSSTSAIGSVASGPVTTRPDAAASAGSVELTALKFVADQDVRQVAVRWPGVVGGWSSLALPNPAESQRQTLTWSMTVAAGDDVATIPWTGGVRPAPEVLLDAVYAKRVSLLDPFALCFRPRVPAELSAYLAHLYAFVIPQALGDCYQQIGNFQRAEDYYLQAAGYGFINTALEVPALWARLANNALMWGDHLYRQEELDAAKQVYSKLVTEAGAAPAAGTSGLFDLPVFTGPVADAAQVFANLADPLAITVNPAIALPIVTIWARWQYLLAGLDYYGTSYTPIFTFEYLQQVALAFAQQAIQAEQDYINFQVHSEAEAATRRDLQGAVALSAAETAGRREQLKSAQSDTAGMEASRNLANLRAANAQADRDRYAVLGYEQAEFQSIAAAHGAHADWHEDEIRRLARDMEAGSWHGDSGKLTAAATLLAGERSYEYQLGRLDDDVAAMKATIPIAEAQLDSARHRENAAQLALAAAALRQSLTSDALAAFENELFTPELWARMAQAMLELSRSFQEWAISSAKLMERAYNFETDNELSVVKSEYPGNTSGGLLGSEYLQRDIESFTYHFVAHQRSKETNVKDVISLATEYPLQFNELRTTGRMTFETSLRDFDHRHPGLFAQRIQSVEVEVIGLLPPEGARGTLGGGGVSRYRSANGGERVRVHTSDTMALSDFTVREDGLVYRQDPRMHGLFEGTGVASTWQLELPRRSNNLDYRLITDIRLVVYYNARFDAALEAAVVSRAPVPGELVHVRSLDLRYDFPEAWYTFLDTKTLAVDLVAQYLPRNETNFRAEKVAVRLMSDGGLPVDGVPLTLTLPGKPAVTAATDADGQIATRPGNDLAAQMGGPLIGPWTLSIDPPAGSALLQADGSLAPGAIEQVAIVIQYDFDWPA